MFVKQKSKCNAWSCVTVEYFDIMLQSRNSNYPFRNLSFCALLPYPALFIIFAVNINKITERGT